MELGGPGSQYLSLGLIHNLFTGLSAPTPIVSSPHSSLKDPFNVSHRSELSYGSWTQSVKSKVLVVACEAPRLPFLAPVTALISFSFPFPSHHSTVATLASVLLAGYPDTALGPLPCCRCLRQMANPLPSFRSLLRCHLLDGPTLMTSATFHPALLSPLLPMPLTLLWFFPCRR